MINYGKFIEFLNVALYIVYKIRWGFMLKSFQFKMKENN